MTDQLDARPATPAADRHILTPEGSATFCGRAPDPDALTLDALEHAQPGGVCLACLGQVMELGRDRSPSKYTAYVWGEQLPQVLSESFPVLAGVHAYRLSAAQVLDAQGDRLTRFEYRPGGRHD